MEGTSSWPRMMLFYKNIKIMNHGSMKNWQKLPRIKNKVMTGFDPSSIKTINIGGKREILSSFLFTLEILH